MAKRLIPTLNRVLVEKILPPSKTVSGILLPEKSSQVNGFLEKFSSLSVSSIGRTINLLDLIERS